MRGGITRSMTPISNKRGLTRFSPRDLCFPTSRGEAYYRIRLSILLKEEW